MARNKQRVRITAACRSLSLMVCLLALCWVRGWAAPNIVMVAAPASVAKYEKYEIVFNITNSVAVNMQWPYEAGTPPGITPAQGISVDAQFTPDNWATVYSQPAFYYQPYDYQVRDGRDWLYPQGSAVWMVRFAPNAPGQWKFRLTARDASGQTTSSEQAFTVTDSGGHGFVRVSSRDARYFEFDDGTYFPALGYNMNWNHVSWNDPVTANQANFAAMGRNGIQLIRIWLSQWALYGCMWNPWRWIGDSADYVHLTGDAAYADHDVSVYLYNNYNPAVSSGHWLSPPIAVKPNTTYRIRVRVKTENRGPRIAGRPYGFVAKVTTDGNSWLWGDGSPHCNDPDVGIAVTEYLPGTSDWTVVSGTWTTPNINFITSFYLTLTNCTDPSVAYVDHVWMEEVLGGGSGGYGPNIIVKPGMNHHQYMDQRTSFAFDKVVELAHSHGVYLKVVLMEWQDWIANSFDQNGNYVSEPNPANFYGNRNVRKIRWLQQAFWRYMQARYGYSPNIFCWEMINEGDPWYSGHWMMADEFAKYMKGRVFGVDLPAVDGVKCTYRHPNFHLVSTSTWASYPKSAFWENPAYPNMDFADVHFYGFMNRPDLCRIQIDGNSVPVAQTDPGFHDTARYTQELSQAVRSYNPVMPVIRGETGLVENGDTNSLTAQLDGDIWGTGPGQGQGIWLHNYVWGHINPGGLIESYWYENYNGRHIYGNKDQRGHFKSYYDFIRNIPLSNGRYQDAAASCSASGMRAWGQKDLSAQRAHLWIQNIGHTWYNVVNQVNIAALSGTVRVAGFQAGRPYVVQWWNPYETNPDLQVVRTESLNAAADGSLTLTVGNLVSDIAVQIMPAEGATAPAPPRNLRVVP
jgi:hypothetical protein